MDDNQIKSEITKRWSLGADRYDSYISHGVKTDREKELWMDAFSKVLPPGRDLVVLDIGCGTGAMGLILSEMGHQVTGLDLSEEMMAKGREKAAAKNLSMTFRRGDAENPPVPKDSADLIICRHLLWTLPRPKATLAAWKEIVQPGGIILAVDGVWGDTKVSSRMRRQVSRRLASLFSPDPSGDHEYSPGVQKALPHPGGVPAEMARSYFTDAGLVQVGVEDLSYIRRDQHARLAWYEKIRSIGSYYLIHGTRT